MKTFSFSNSLLAVCFCFAFFPGVLGAYNLQEVPFADNFSNPSVTATNWVNGSLFYYDSAGFAGPSVRVGRTAPGAGSSISYHSLPTNLQGHTILVKVQVKGSNVSVPPASYNGVKVMVFHASRTPTNTVVSNWPGATMPTGTFDWTNVSLLVPLPKSLTALSLQLGLQDSTGDVWFDEASVKVVELPNNIPFHPGEAVYTGHENIPRLRGAMVQTNVGLSNGADTGAPLRVLGADWKANLVRWQLFATARFDMMAPGFDLEFTNQMRNLERAIPFLQSNRMMVVLDWHLNNGPMQSAAHNARFTNFWRSLALRFKDQPLIWGYDLLNEPKPDDWREGSLMWNDLADAAAAEIRKVDKTRTLIKEVYIGMGHVTSFGNLRPLATSNAVYSFHMYNPGAYTHQFVLPGFTNEYIYPGNIGGTDWNIGRMELDLAPAVAFASNYSAHIYVGEFSAARWAPGASNYLADCITLFEKYKWDWSYHAFREAPCWGLEYTDDRTNNQLAPVPPGRQLAVRALFASNVKPFLPVVTLPAPRCFGAQDTVILGLSDGLGAQSDSKGFYSTAGALGPYTPFGPGGTSFVVSSATTVHAYGQDPLGNRSRTNFVSVTPYGGGLGRALWRVYSNLAGSSLADLTNAPSYLADQAYGSNFLGELRGPSSWSGNYGALVKGYLKAPTTGTYEFYVASDNASEFRLSTNSSAAGKSRVCYLNGYTGTEAWSTYSNQKGTRNLVAGQKYYFEILFKADGSYDHMEVGWKRPGDSAITVIPGVSGSFTNLSTW